MIKLTYIISDINNSIAFEWIAEVINKKQFALSFIILNPGPSLLESHLRENGLTVYYILCRGKKDWPKATIMIFDLLKKMKPDIVHCHLIQANIIGLIAARIAGVKKRIYTRHHSSLHHVYHPKGILWDKLSNSLATDIIAISGIVKDILIKWEKANYKKVKLIPHGFKLSTFEDVDEKLIDDFHLRHNLSNQNLIIGVVSRFTAWKGVQFIIPAFKKLLKIYPDAVLLLLNAKGDYEMEIKMELQSFPASSYRLITFEKNVAAAFKSMDVFVHVPIDEHSEAFGQIYVEALASGVPSVFTLSGIAPDFIVDQNNALVVPFKNSDAIYNAIITIVKNNKLREWLVENGSESIKEKFDLKVMIQNLEMLYAGE